MERALRLENLTAALGEHRGESPRRLPTPQELQELLAEAEVRIFLRETEIPLDLIRTGWYLHGIASASAAAELYMYPRQRRAFEISAHIFDLALNDEARSRHEKLELAFGAQVGYRRAELDPNATAIFFRVETLFIREPPIEAHFESLAVEAGVAFLGFQTRSLFGLYETWLRQLQAVTRQTQIGDLWGTMFGPSHRVVAGCLALLRFLAFGTQDELRRARSFLEEVVFGEEAEGDLTARWVASHLLDYTDAAEHASVWTLLPPDIPPVARQAFTLAAPPVLNLWPPQRELFANEPDRPQPLSPDARRVVLSIPTSSGKTLLAQLMIIAHLARGGGDVCYVAPLRSLGREVRLSMRNRLRVLAREMAAELPDFGPLYDLFDRIEGRESVSIEELAEVALREPTLLERLIGMASSARFPDVEIMTPERLGHLLRRDPDAILERFRMFVFDEAHLLSERGRGFTLETILSFLHWKTRATAHRIVLLSAALGNRGQVMAWLDPNSEGALITSEWRGPRRLHAIFTTRPEWSRPTEMRVNTRDWPVRKTFPLTGVIRLRPAEGTTPRALSITEPVGQLALRYNERGELRRPKPKDGPPHSTQQYKMTARMVVALGAFGSVLVVTSTRRIAQDMAREVADLLSREPRAQPLVDFVAQRLGSDHPLVPVLRNAVAFHHAALPVDVLEELEQALRDGVLKFMTSTSTLTEGVNLPVRTVVLAETAREDAEALLSGARLINAMGRAGRAGKESEGWVVLVRAAEERPEDFDLMSPRSEELELRSQLASERALQALADFEEALRREEDAAFTFAAQEMNDFVAFVWFILASEETSGIPLDEVDVDSALASTLGFVQLADAERARWRAAAEVVRRAYAGADVVRRRSWAHAGTSISTARTLDVLADEVTALVVRLAGERPELQTRPLDLREAMQLLTEAQVFRFLLGLPENERPWVFRQTRSWRSAEVPVNPEEILEAWLAGTSVSELASSFLPTVVEADWRVEQIVDAIAQHFEHFLAWTSGVLIELVNDRLGSTPFETRLCQELPAYVRYGVGTELALQLLLSGVRSRRLALAIAAQAVAEEIGGNDLRTWLGAMALAELRDRFDASASELLDLLEYARTRGGSVLRSLLEEGRTEIEVRPEQRPGQEVGAESAAAVTTDEDAAAVEVREMPGEERPPRLGVFDVGDGRLRALVPTPLYGDIQSILDTGVPTRSFMRGTTVEITLAPDAGG